jgi:D-alanyl-D-alanine carboxypeptidase/D-alanyl-D-alanine-endopeptidase (penicillin-binding protein 4)
MILPRARRAWLILAVAAAAACWPRSPWALPLTAQEQTDLHHQLRGLVRRGAVAVAIDGKLAFQHGKGSFVPASILKLATAQAALKLLGPDFRFRTEVYLDAANNLYVRGYGDPFLVSEEWRRMAGELERLGVFDLPLAQLVLDGGAFDPDLRIDGVEYTLNPYDARPGALVSNFNTANVRVFKGGRVESAEPQTPLTPLARELARKLRRGEHRINLSRNPANGPRYSAELALAIFRAQGAHIAGIAYRPVPAGLRPLLVHFSEQTLREVVAGMLEFSNNFIANQILLTLALRETGPPARLEAGVERLRRFLTEDLGLAPESFHLVEGSGISRLNRVDIGAMLRITDAFYPWRGLLKPHAVGSRSLLAKTGTLSDVHSLAGFLPAPEGERRVFVIMLNQRRHVRERVLERLLTVFADPAWDPTGAP